MNALCKLSFSEATESINSILSYITCKFFTATWAGDLSLESIWQVSSGLQNSSEYFGHAQQGCHLDGFCSSSDFQFFQFPIHASGDCSKCTNYNWYHYQPNVSLLFLVLRQGPSICQSFCFLLFPLFCSWEWQNPLDGKCFFFLLINTKSGLLSQINWSICNSKSQIYGSHSQGKILVCTYTIW